MVCDGGMLSCRLEMRLSHWGAICVIEAVNKQPEPLQHGSVAHWHVSRGMPEVAVFSTPRSRCLRVAPLLVYDFSCADCDKAVART